VLQLITKGSTAGVWCKYAGEAEFRIRRIPRDIALRMQREHFGAKSQIRRKNGELIVDSDDQAQTAFNREAAAFALVDSRNVVVPAEVLAGTELAEAAADAEGCICVDGKWSEPVKTAVFTLLRDDFYLWVLKQEAGLTAKAAQEEADAGKTS
jgi:hypothetical protein